MDPTAAETTPSRGFYPSSSAAHRSAGGKLKRPPSRKPPTTPYFRAPTNKAERGKRRWLSSVVNPAYSLISGGATRLFTSLFSSHKSSNSIALPAPRVHLHHYEEKDDVAVEIEENADDGEEHIGDLDNRVSGTETEAGPSREENNLNDGSCFQGHSVDNNGNLSDESELSEIEQLIKGKKFSRVEVNRLMEIIQSKAVEHPTMERGKEKLKTAEVEAKGPVNTHAVPNALSENFREDSSKAAWGTSTPLLQSAVMPRREENSASTSHIQRNKIAASPIEIAKAYMGSRTSDTNDRIVLHNNDLASTPFIPASSTKPSTFCPDSMVQNQRDHSTPQSLRGRYGLHNLPRTPYSRTIFSNSKSKFSPLQGGDKKAQTTSSTPFRHLQTPGYGQIGEKSKDGALDGGYGSSVGPMRRTQNKAVMQTPTRGSPYLRSSLIGTPHVENSHIRKEILPAGKKNFELGRISGKSPIQSIDKQPSSSQVGVDSHSSQIARTILEHINRNTPTPKDKSEELKLVTGWKKSATSLKENGNDSLLLAGSSSSIVISNENKKKPALENAEKWNSLYASTPKPTLKVADVKSNGLFSDGSAGKSLTKNAEEAFPQTTITIVDPEVLNQPMKLLFQPPETGTKHNFPAISIDKPDLTWKGSRSSSKSSTFTIPVSTSSMALSEPPTSSIMPTSAASPYRQARAVPTYSFGSKNSDRLGFTFSSTDDVAPIVTSDFKFSFGSDKPRLSFKDAICH